MVPAMQQLRYVHSANSVTPAGDMIEMPEIDRFSLLERPSGPRIHVLAVEQTIRWRDRLLEEYSFGPHPARRDAGEYNTGQYYVASFSDALVDLKMGCVIIDGRDVWSDSAAFTIMHGPVDRSPAIVADGDQRFLNMDASPAPLTIDGPAMMICHWGCLGNYGHWMMNSLLPVVLMLDEIKARKITVLVPTLPPRWREELTLFGVPESQIVEVADQYVVVPHLLYPSTVSTSSNNYPAPFGLQVFEAARQAVAPSPDLPSPELLYVSRMGAKHWRTMTNEVELSAALETLGFTAIYPHNMTWAEQIAAFSKAKVIIGQFGAALWSIPFSPKGGALIEITTSNYGNHEYAAVANLMEKDVILIGSDPTSIVASYHFDFEAPLDKVVHAAKSMAARYAPRTRLREQPRKAAMRLRQLMQRYRSQFRRAE